MVDEVRMLAEMEMELDATMEWYEEWLWDSQQSSFDYDDSWSAYDDSFDDYDPYEFDSHWDTY